MSTNLIFLIESENDEFHRGVLCDTSMKICNFNTEVEAVDFWKKNKKRYKTDGYKFLARPLSSNALRKRISEGLELVQVAPKKGELITTFDDGTHVMEEVVINHKKKRRAIK